LALEKFQYPVYLSIYLDSLGMRMLVLASTPIERRNPQSYPAKQALELNDMIIFKRQAAPTLSADTLQPHMELDLGFRKGQPRAAAFKRPVRSICNMIVGAPASSSLLRIIV
jgi:hypothetical protein